MSATAQRKSRIASQTTASNADDRYNKMRKSGCFSESPSIYSGDGFVAVKDPPLKAGGAAFRTAGAKKFHGPASGCFSYEPSVNVGDEYKPDWLRQRDYDKAIKKKMLGRSKSLGGRPGFKACGSRSKLRSVSSVSRSEQPIST